MLCTTATNTSNTIRTQIECRRRNEDRVFNKQQRSYILSQSTTLCHEQCRTSAVATR